MEWTQKLTWNAHSLASWLLVMAGACVGCSTPIHQHRYETLTACCKAGCDRPQCAQHVCSHCEASCFGYEPTCWSRWPAACPSNCPIEGGLPADPAVLLHEEEFFDGVYEAVPPWNLPSGDVEPAPHSSTPRDGHSTAKPLTSDSSVGAPPTSTSAKGTVSFDQCDDESSQSRSMPRTGVGTSRSTQTLRDAPLLSDVDPRTSSFSITQTPRRDVPTMADITTSDGAKEAEASAPVSSRRRANRAPPARVPEIAQTAAITTAKSMSAQGMVRTADMEIMVTDDSTPLASIRRRPTSAAVSFFWPEEVPTTPPMAAAEPTATAPDFVNKDDKSHQGFNIRRLPEVEEVEAATPMSRPLIRPVSGDGKVMIRFTQDQGQTSAAVGDTTGGPATVRFR